MSIEVSPDLFKKMAGSSLTKNDAADGLKEENSKLRELCEMAASKLDTEEADDETKNILSAMREIGIKVRG